MTSYISIGIGKGIRISVSIGIVIVIGISIGISIIICISMCIEYIQRHVGFVNVQLSLHENVVFSVCAHLGNAAYIIFIMWNSISDLEAWYHFRFNISCGVAVTVRGHQKKSGNF